MAKNKVYSLPPSGTFYTSPFFKQYLKDSKKQILHAHKSPWDENQHTTYHAGSTQPKIEKFIVVDDLDSTATYVDPAQIKPAKITSYENIFTALGKVQKTYKPPQQTEQNMAKKYGDHLIMQRNGFVVQRVALPETGLHIDPSGKFEYEGYGKGYGAFRSITLGEKPIIGLEDEPIIKALLAGTLPQKMRGVWLYRLFHVRYNLDHVPPPLHARLFLSNAELVDNGSDGESVLGFYGSGHPYVKDVFLRPCPFVPNHGQKVAGFESISVPREKAFDVLRGMLKELPKNTGVIIMPTQKSLVSAVAMHDRVVFGEGTDGVTAGHGRTWTVPARWFFWSSIMDAMGEDPLATEMELVAQTAYDSFDPMKVGAAGAAPQMNFVQARASTPIPPLSPKPTENAVMGYVPGGKVVVGRVVTLKGLEDIGSIETNASTKNVVFVQKEGNLLSHASATARTFKLPLVVNADIKKGDTLIDAGGGWVVVNEEYEKTDSAYNPEQYKDDFMRGIRYGFARSEKGHALFGLDFHQLLAGPINDPKFTAFLGGVYVAWIANAAYLACLGELRHARTVETVSQEALKRGYGTHMIRHLLSWAQHGTHDKVVDVNGERDDVYAKVRGVNLSLWGRMKIISEVARTFRLLRWSGAYGGQNWAMCAYSTRLLMKAIIEGDFSKIAARANTLEHQVHNGGSLFNKFVADQVLNLATRGVTNRHELNLAAASYLAGNVLYDRYASGKDRTIVTNYAKKEVEYDHTTTLRLRQGVAQSAAKLIAEAEREQELKGQLSLEATKLQEIKNAIQLNLYATTNEIATTYILGESPTPKEENDHEQEETSAIPATAWWEVEDGQLLV